MDKVSEKLCVACGCCGNDISQFPQDSGMHLIRSNRLMHVQVPQVVMNLIFCYSGKGFAPLDPILPSIKKWKGRKWRTAMKEESKKWEDLVTEGVWLPWAVMKPAWGPKLPRMLEATPVDNPPDSLPGLGLKDSAGVGSKKGCNWYMNATTASIVRVSNRIVIQYYLKWYNCEWSNIANKSSVFISQLRY